MMHAPRFRRLRGLPGRTGMVLLLGLGSLTVAGQQYYMVLDPACGRRAVHEPAPFADARSELLRRVRRVSAEGLAAWRAQGCVAWSEAVPEPRTAGGPPDDPGWLDEGGPWSGGQPALDLVGAPAAWALAGARSAAWAGPAALGLVDRWVDSAHEDLRGGVRPHWMFDSADAHGTLVAGLMAAATGNGIGMASLAGGLPGPPPLLHVRWMGDPDRAVLELARSGVGVVAAPWISRCTRSPIQDAVYAEIREHGTLVVAAAGNGPGGASCGADGHGPAYPAALDGVLSVSTVGHVYPRGHADGYHWRDVHDLHPLDTVPQTHTHHATVDLVAPGHGVWTTRPAGGYGQAWGTSFAVPLVAAAAAAVRRENPCLDPEAVTGLLRATAVVVDTLPENRPYAGRLGAGRLDAGAALVAARGVGALRVNAGEHLVWSGGGRVRDSVVVAPGGTWTVRGRVCFDSAAVLRVAPGGRLVLDGAELRPTGRAPWAGIRAEGRRDRVPPPRPGLPSPEHASVDWRGDAIVRGADTGLVARHGAWVLATGGAVLDCRTALVVRHAPHPWTGLLRGIRLAWTPEAPEGEGPLLRLRAARDVRLEGIALEDARAGAAGTGLSAEKAGFRLGAAPDGTPARFEGLWRAVDAWSPAGAVPGGVTLADAELHGCRQGAVLSGLWMPLLERLSVRLAGAGRWDGDPAVGLYLDACPGARVRDLLVDGTDAAADHGLVLHASGLLPGALERNVWRGLWRGVSVLGVHGDAENGWRLSCQDFLDSGTDLHLAGRWTAADGSASGEGGSRLALVQGDCAARPAGNRHGPAPNVEAGPTVPRHLFFHHADPDHVPDAGDPARLRAVSCGRPFRPADCAAPASIGSAADSLALAALRARQLEASIDNGDTGALLAAVASGGIGAWRLEAILSEAWPYFSDTVLLALLDRYPNVSQPFFEELLLACGPWSEAVYARALERLPPAAHPALEALQASGAASPRETLRAASGTWRAAEARWRGTLADSARMAGDDAGRRRWSGRAEGALALALASADAVAADSLLGLPGADTLTGAALLDALRRRLGAWRPLPPSLADRLRAEARRSGWPGRLAANALRWNDGVRPALAWGADAGVARSGALEAFARTGEHPVRAWPNPLADAPAWTVRGMPEGTVWSLYDASGRLRARGRAAEPVPANGLPPGLYRLVWPGGSLGLSRTPSGFSAGQ